MPQNTVLLIEADITLRRLITLGLQYRGMHVIDASSTANLPSLENQQPGLVVLDVDGEVGDNHALLADARAHPLLAALPMVVLAWECSLQLPVTCLTKPFDARTLHATIERLLITSKEITTSKTQELLLEAQTASPSIWPLVTAAGLLLAFTGIMISITLLGLGLLIVVIALLMWTLGMKTEKKSLSIEIGNTYPTSVH